MRGGRRSPSKAVRRRPGLARTRPTTPRPPVVRLPSFAKINLGLEVLGRREDGYHELRTLFQTIDLHDDVELRPAKSGVTVRCAHPAVPNDDSNLAVRAARELQRHARTTAGVSITIEKRIPVAGGLGGGSSNAATVLLGLDRMWGVGLGPAGLHPLARRLGADVPYFLLGGTALGLARGDEVYPLHDQIEGHVVVVDPGRPLSTAAVFARLDRALIARENGQGIFRFVSGHLEGAGAYRFLTNDLEQAAWEEAPDLAETARWIREVLDREGALLARLSGSGSSLFGLFDDLRRARRAVASLASLGIQALRARTVPLAEYRRILAGSWGRRGEPGKERTSWKSRTSRSSR